MPSCTPGSSTTLHYGFCLPADGETNWGTAYRSTMTAIDQQIFNVGIPRSYLAGLNTTPTVSSTSISISDGVAMGNDQATAIRLTSTLVKVLSSSWAVGTGNGGLYAATTIQGNQTYHLIAILRTDTSVVDAYFDTVATAVNIPSPYTIYRRIASLRTGTSSNMLNYVQDGDYFRLKIALLDVNATNPGATAVTAPLSVPSGINVQAQVNAFMESFTSASNGLYLSDLASDDQAASLTVAPLANIVGDNNTTTRASGVASVRTNTAGKIRYRLIASGAADVVRISTLGWFDTRGRDD